MSAHPDDAARTCASRLQPEPEVLESSFYDFQGCGSDSVQPREFRFGLPGEVL